MKIKYIYVEQAVKDGEVLMYQAESGPRDSRLMWFAEFRLGSRHFILVQADKDRVKEEVEKTFKEVRKEQQ